MAALAAVGAASAQSTVTVSGGMALGIGSTETGGVSTGNQIVRQTGNLAFKGTEDLGGGLKANFEVQTSIGAHAASSLNVNGKTAAATTLGDRGLYVNVQGGFGTVQAGRANSAVRSLWGAIGDVSRLSVVSGISAGNSTSTSDAAGGDANARVIYGDAYANWVGYTSPTFNGFTAAVAVLPVDGKTSATKDAMSYSLQYANGPLTVAYNLTDSKQVYAGNAFTQDTGTAAEKAYTAAQGAYKLNTLLASYDFGVAKVGATYQTIKLAAGVNPGNAAAVTATIPVGPGSVGLGYGKRSATANTEVQFGDDVKQAFVGYRYDLSKRTNLQLVWNKINRNASTGANTADVKETHLIVAHTF